MHLIAKIRHVATRDWVIGLFLLSVFLLTNGYIYGWDDQHLEIPLLKSLIDPDLYPGDYYVEGLKDNFTSYLYPLLARVISTEQIPAAFLLLFLLSRFIFFTFIYRFWHLLSGDRLEAVLCTLMVMLLGRVDEFLYRTFSHQEFALAIIFIGIFLFYRDRYLLSALTLGLAANFHVLYSLFPFTYMLLYLAVTQKGADLKSLAKTTGAFLAGSLPIIIWVIHRKLLASPQGTSDPSEWMNLYKIACPQNLVLYDNSLGEVLRDWTLLLERVRPYLILLVFLGLNQIYNEAFRRDRKTKIAIVCGFGLIGISFLFTYLWPIRQVLDLNLIRNNQYIMFFLMGYTALLTARLVMREKLWLVMPFLTAFVLIRFGDMIALYTGGLMFILLTMKTRIDRGRQQEYFRPILSFLAICSIILAVGIGREFQIHRFSQSALLCLIITIALIWVAGIWHDLLKNSKQKYLLRLFLLLLPFAALITNYVGYHRTHIQIEKTGMGFWQLQRNWLDMQRYVKNHLPKNALLLVPHDMEMGGFRIFSERPILVSYRDCGVIGFDYSAAVEWQTRIREVGDFKVLIDKPLTTALKNAIEKYQVNYIVFMLYTDPGGNALLEPIYRNETFALYKVKPNSVQLER